MYQLHYQRMCEDENLPYIELGQLRVLIDSIFQSQPAYIAHNYGILPKDGKFNFTAFLRPLGHNYPQQQYIKIPLCTIAAVYTELLAYNCVPHAVTFAGKPFRVTHEKQYNVLLSVLWNFLRARKDDPVSGLLRLYEKEADLCRALEDSISEDSSIMINAVEKWLKTEGINQQAVQTTLLLAKQIVTLGRKECQWPHFMGPDSVITAIPDFFEYHLNVLDGELSYDIAAEERTHLLTSIGGIQKQAMLSEKMIAALLGDTYILAR